MVSVLVSSAVDREFESRSSQPKAIKLVCICCFSSQHTALKRKSTDWLPRNQNNMSEWAHAWVNSRKFSESSIQHFFMIYSTFGTYRNYTHLLYTYIRPIDHNIFSNLVSIDIFHSFFLHTWKRPIAAILVC